MYIFGTIVQDESDLGNGESMAPFFFQNVKANASIVVDMVKPLSPKYNLR